MRFVSSLLLNKISFKELMLFYIDFLKRMKKLNTNSIQTIIEKT